MPPQCKVERDTQSAASEVVQCKVEKPEEEQSDDAAKAGVGAVVAQDKTSYTNSESEEEEERVSKSKSKSKTPVRRESRSKTGTPTPTSTPGAREEKKVDFEEIGLGSNDRCLDQAQT